MSVSEIFDPAAWRSVDGFDDLTDVTYHRAIDQGTVRIAFDRPEVRNAFRPHTVDELYRCLDHARMSSRRRLRAADWQRAVPRRTAAGRSAQVATSASEAASGYQYEAGDPASRRRQTRLESSTRRGSGGCTSSSASG